MGRKKHPALEDALMGGPSASNGSKHAKSSNALEDFSKSSKKKSSLLVNEADCTQKPSSLKQSLKPSADLPVQTNSSLNNPMQKGLSSNVASSESDESCDDDSDEFSVDSESCGNDDLPNELAAEIHGNCTETVCQNAKENNINTEPAVGSDINTTSSLKATVNDLTKSNSLMNYKLAALGGDKRGKTDKPTLVRFTLSDCCGEKNLVDGGIVDLDLEEADQKIATFKHALVGRMIGRRFQFSWLQEKLLKLWNDLGVTNVQDLGEDCFIIFFDDRDSRDKVWLGGPWHVAGHAVGLDAWSPAFRPSRDAPMMAPIWVRLPGLPLEFWGERNLSLIGSQIGEPICSDVYTSSLQRTTFARICIRCDLKKPLPAGTKLRGRGGKIDYQSFIYEGINVICAGCGLVGHSKDHCPATILSSPTQIQDSNIPGSVSEELVWRTVLPRKPRVASKGATQSQKRQSDLLPVRDPINSSLPIIKQLPETTIQQPPMIQKSNVNSTMQHAMQRPSYRNFNEGLVGSKLQQLTNTSIGSGTSQQIIRKGNLLLHHASSSSVPGSSSVQQRSRSKSLSRRGRSISVKRDRMAVEAGFAPPSQ